MRLFMNRHGENEQNKRMHNKNGFLNSEICRNVIYRKLK